MGICDFFFFLLEVDCMKQHPPLYSSKPRSMACALRNVTVLKICQSEVPEDRCSLQTLVTPAAVFESRKEEKRPQRPKFCFVFFFKPLFSSFGKTKLGCNAVFSSECDGTGTVVNEGWLQGAF